MAWRDTLRTLREELAEVRAERQRQAAAEDAEIRQQREELSRLANSLELSRLLNEMNATLLNGQGSIETIVSWEAPAEAGDEDLDDTEEEEGDLIAVILTWVEAGDREIAVDLGLGEDGTYLQVNGVDIRQESEALEQALVEAFRDELEL
ncbi:MAG: hypothetical protein BZY88_02125 [SAR202 cluster bacterium Io17-Chloro-G9]|nr:MAG: hypothetical protein BZY88_02125 [SAR202 cluster bacterium Io17-Chloro-G9]